MGVHAPFSKQFLQALSYASVLWIDLHGATEMVGRVLEIAFFCQCHPKTVMSHRQVRVICDRLAIMFYRFVNPPLKHQGIAQVYLGQGELRLDFQGLAVVLDRLLRSGLERPKSIQYCYGRLHRRAGDLDRTLKAITIESYSLFFRQVYLARALALQGKRKDALQEYQETIRLLRLRSRSSVSRYRYI